MSVTTAWGIVGLGNIAGKFASDLALVPGTRLRAVASRDVHKARSFSEEFGAEQAYGSYAALFADPEVEVVYIASPHSFHREHTLAALQAGKHVLCEKPMGINSREVKQVLDLAGKKGLFLMEALWSRFNPSIREVYQLVRTGDLGPLSYLRADFAFPALDRDPLGRLLNPALAGGSLLDIGIYPVFLAYLLLGVPGDFKVLAHFHISGVEKQVALLFDYPEAIAVLYSGFSSRSEMKAEISCRDGSIFLSPRWHRAESYTVEREGEMSHIELPLKGSGYTYEIEEVQSCLKEGKVQSDLWSWEDSRALHDLLDKIRQSAGIAFPGES
ncbi:MAG: Gfo/Idh/MocA family oxidoreductase [Flavobacteriaceae bacterium]|nr:MAG: Gfo/Idh/MocA family oxidoreductase [Flavobacteriaceae bacterium]